MYLPQSSFVSTLLSGQCRGAAEGETGRFWEGGGGRNGEAQGQRQRKGFVHAVLRCCTAALWAWQAAVEWGSTREVTTDPLSLFTARAHGVGRKKSFPGIKEILAAWLIKVEGEERGRRNRGEQRRWRQAAGSQRKWVRKVSNGGTAELLRHEEAGIDTSDLMFISGTARRRNLVLHGGDNLLQLVCRFLPNRRSLLLNLIGKYCFTEDTLSCAKCSQMLYVYH